jgi:hypothetical protein
MKNTIGYFKHQGITEADFPLVLFSYDWEHIQETGHSPLYLGVKYFTCQTPMLVPGWIAEAFRASDGQWDYMVFSPRQRQVMLNVWKNFIFDDGTLYHEQWAKIVKQVGEDVEIDFQKLLKLNNAHPHILDSAEDDYYCYRVIQTVDVSHGWDL